MNTKVVNILIAVANLIVAAINVSAGNYGLAVLAFGVFLLLIID
jgi:hypothetical protein